MKRARRVFAGRYINDTAASGIAGINGGLNCLRSTVVSLAGRAVLPDIKNVPGRRGRLAWKTGRECEQSAQREQNCPRMMQGFSLLFKRLARTQNTRMPR